MAVMSLVLQLLVLSAPHPTKSTIEARLAPPSFNTSYTSLRAAATVGSHRRGPASALSVPDGAGGQYISWSDTRDGTYDVILQRVTNTGAPAAGWPADGLVICNAPGYQGDAALFPDGANGVVLGWYDARDELGINDIYAQRVNSAGVPQWTANGVKVVEGTYGIQVAGAPDGAGGLLVAWIHSLEVDPSVYALRITGAGAVATGWNANGVLVCDAEEFQYNATIISDGAGGAIVAWEDYRPSTEPGSAQQVLNRSGFIPHVYAQRVDAAGSPQWTANGVLVDDGVIGAQEPALCPAPGGHALVFWAEQGAGPTRGQRLDGSGVAQWTAGGVALHPSGVYTDREVAAVPDGSGGAIVAWFTSDVMAEGYQAQRVDGTGAVQWGAAGASVVGHQSASSYDLDFVPDGTGGAYFSWEDTHGDVEGDLYAQRVTSTGTIAWTEDGIAVAAIGRFQGRPSAVVDGSGELLLCWGDQRNSDDDIFTQRFTSGGVAQLAQDGVATFLNPGVQYGPLVLQTADGGTLLVWSEKRGSQYDIRARKLNDDGTPAGPATVVCDKAGRKTLLAFIDDGAGGGIVAWSIEETVFDENIFAQRIDANAAPLWTANGVAVCTEPGFQGAARCVSDGAGGAIFAWYDGRDKSNPDVYAQRLNASGVPQWAANGTAVCADPGVQDEPALAPDGAGGAIVAWPDRRMVLPHVYAQRMNASGTPQWAADGVLIADYTPELVEVRVTGMVPSASSEVIVLINELVFDQVTYTTSCILHAQKVNGSGAPQWGIEGATVCDASSFITLEQLVGDGSGGVYVGWSDDRNAGFDIFAQHVDLSGTSTWNPTGNVVCDRENWQYLGGMTSSSGDVFFAWADDRSGRLDVRAQRLNSLGAEVWVADGVDVCDDPRGQYFVTLAPWKTATPERLYMGWTDNRAGNERHVYAQRLDFSGNHVWVVDGVTSAQISLASFEANAERVRLVWYSSEGVTATVHRRVEDAEWAAIGSAFTDGTGQIVFEDRDVAPGARYGYRLGIREGSSETFLGEVWVEVPSNLKLALDGLRPNPAVRDLVISFTLPRGNDAKLEWLDLAGRRVQSHELVGLSPGRHTMRLDAALPASGVYFLRLTQSGLTVAARGAVVK